jgi:hypothetical protein
VMREKGVLQQFRRDECGFVLPPSHCSKDSFISSPASFHSKQASWNRSAERASQQR